MISVWLQYSTPDLRFLRANLIQCSKFSEDIIVTIATHLFSGEPENPERIKKSLNIISEFPNTTIKFINIRSEEEKPIVYYHNYSRFEGARLAKYDWVLFLDADEIVSDEFKDWFDINKGSNKAYNLACHWYFREPIYQAVQKESASVLIKKEDLVNWDLYNRLELKQFYQKLYDEDRLEHGDFLKSDPQNGRPNPNTLSLTGNIMVHHYSWVRSEQEMLKKVANWGHRDDKDWTKLVKEEFSRPFNGTDFVHNYQYRTVSNKFNL